MKVFKSNQKIYFLSFLLVVLSGCWSSSDKKNTSADLSNTSSSLDDTTLMTIDGKVVLTVAEYENLLNVAMQSNQQIAMILEAVPGGEQNFIFKGVASGKLMRAWGQKNGIDKSAEFMQEQKQAYDMVDFQMYMKYYEDAHPTHVSDKELKDFYEENKVNIPQLIASAGGVEAQFVRFDGKEAAQKFFDQVKDGSEKKFVDAAEASNLTLQESLINQSSQFSQPIKKFAETVSKTPYVSIVKVDNDSYWVIQALHKKETEYRSLETPEIKEGLRQMLMGKKREAELDKNMEALKVELNVVENHEYFAKKEKMRQKDREEFVQDQSELDSEDDQDIQNDTSKI